MMQGGRRGQAMPAPEEAGGPSPPRTGRAGPARPIHRRGGMHAYQRREQVSRLRKHHTQLRSINPTLDTWNAQHLEVTRLHRLNRRRNRVREAREREIQRANEKLVERITVTAMKTQFKFKSKKAYSASRHSGPHQPRSLNSQNRKKEQSRIARENLALAKRIIEKRPVYNKRDWRDHSKRHSGLLNSISRYVDVPYEEAENAGGLDSRASSRQGGRWASPGAPIALPPLTEEQRHEHMLRLQEAQYQGEQYAAMQMQAMQGQQQEEEGYDQPLSEFDDEKEPLMVSDEKEEESKVAGPRASGHKMGNALLLVVEPVLNRALRIYSKLDPPESRVWLMAEPSSAPDGDDDDKQSTAVRLSASRGTSDGATLWTAASISGGAPLYSLRASVTGMEGGGQSEWFLGAEDNAAAEAGKQPTGQVYAAHSLDTWGPFSAKWRFVAPMVESAVKDGADKVAFLTSEFGAYLSAGADGELRCVQEPQDATLWALQLA